MKLRRNSIYLNIYITNKETELAIKKKKKKCHKEKPKSRWLHWWLLPNMWRRINTNPSQNLPPPIEKKRRELINKASIILIPNPNEDITQKKKVIDQYRCKNPQQNTSKPNPGTYVKDYIAWPNMIYPKNSKLVYHLKTNQCNIMY